MNGFWPSSAAAPSAASASREPLPPAESSMNVPKWWSTANLPSSAARSITAPRPSSMRLQ